MMEPKVEPQNELGWIFEDEDGPAIDGSLLQKTNSSESCEIDHQ